MNWDVGSVVSEHLPLYEEGRKTSCLHREEKHLRIDPRKRNNSSLI